MSNPAEFLHIGFRFAGAPKVTELEPTFSQAIDWLRYAPNCWIVYTTSSAEVWSQRLKPHLGEKDLFLIIRLDLRERQGWMSKMVWDWIDKYRS